jgi:16S rRNA (cytosine1407-C5)-methyltransferase
LKKTGNPDMTQPPSSPRFSDSLKRFTGILSEDDLRKIIAIQDAALPTGLRINPLKADPTAAIVALAQRYNWQVTPLAFCDHAWLIHSADFSPGRTIEHRLGEFYLQDAASMVPVSLFDFDTPRPRILDMAASPGGKTTHLIDRAQDQGLILANDASRSRIPALRSVLATWGGVNQVVTNFPGESFGAWFPETFDFVLLDAPCSMENLRPTPNHPLRQTTQGERLRLQERQIQLLISGLGALKIGGQIVYATCSLAPEEDEAVIDRVLRAHSGAFVVEQVADRLPFKTPGLTAFENETYHPSLVHALRLWPHLTGMSGFFCARLKKVRPLPIAPETPPSREFARTGLAPASPLLQSDINTQLLGRYGFDLLEVMQASQARLFTRHASVFLIPGAYLEQFSTLPFEYIGLPLGQWLGDTLQPAHEFFSRFGRFFTRGKIRIEDDQVDTWTAGRDIRYPNTDRTPAGQYLLVEDRDGRILGMGKLLERRLRNMLPRAQV